MELNEELALSYYRPLKTVAAQHGFQLVQHIETGAIFAERRLSTHNAGVFRTLKEHPVPGTPHICELAEDGETLIVIEEYFAGDTLSESSSQDSCSHPREYPSVQPDSFAGSCAETCRFSECGADAAAAVRNRYLRNRYLQNRYIRNVFRNSKGYPRHRSASEYTSDRRNLCGRWTNVFFAETHCKRTLRTGTSCHFYHKMYETGFF